MNVEKEKYEYCELVFIYTRRDMYHYLREENPLKKIELIKTCNERIKILNDYGYLWLLDRLTDRQYIDLRNMMKGTSIFPYLIPRKNA